MNYIIHQKNLIDPKHQQDFFDKEAQKKLKLIHKALSGYRKPINLDIYVGKTSADEYQISIALPMRSKLLYLEEKGYQPVLLIHQLLDKLRAAVQEQLKIERKEHLRKRKARQQKNLQEFVLKLEKQYLKNEEEAFKHLLLQVIPSLKGYINRRLQMAQATSLLKSKTFRVEELVDEVFLKIYDRFLQKPENEQELLPWIYRIADEVIEAVLHEKEFEMEHLEHLDLLVAREYLDLKERFTVDADGDLVMIEELDDPSYQINFYEPDVVLEDRTGTEILEKISEQYDARAFHEEVSKILASQPSLHRTVFDLFWLEQFTAEEIAEIKSVSVEKVREILEDVSTLILKNLRFESETD